MKLRIQDDSLRLRLTRSEVARIARGLPVQSTCRFPGGSTLTYALTLAETSTVDAALASNRIDVSVPRAAAMRWAAGSDVTLGGAPHDIGAVRVLIEKDFACVAPRDGEDTADYYPNPNARGADSKRS